MIRYIVLIAMLGALALSACGGPEGLEGYEPEDLATEQSASALHPEEIDRESIPYDQYGHCSAEAYFCQLDGGCTMNPFEPLADPVCPPGVLNECSHLELMCVLNFNPRGNP